MVRPNQESIDTFMSITGASELVAVQKLEERGGDLNEAVNAYFSEGDRNATHETSVAAPRDDFMDIDDPIQVSSREPSLPLLSGAGGLNPFSLLDPNFNRSLVDSTSQFTTHAPFVSHPREVREIPIEVKDGNGPSNQSGIAPTIVDVTDTAQVHGPEIHGTVIIDDDDDDTIRPAPSAQVVGRSGRRDDTSVDGSHERHPRPSAPEFNDLTAYNNDLPAYNNDIEEEMIRAAIEASKREVQEGHSSQQFGAPDDLGDTGPQPRHSHLEDPELAHAVSLSLKTAEQEKALRQQVEKVGTSESGAYNPPELEQLGKYAASNGRQGFRSSDKGTSSHPIVEAGSSSILDETEDLEEQPLVRHRTRRVSSGSMDSAKEVGEIGVSPPSSPGHNNSIQAQNSGNDFHSDEWGGISSVEHDEAVMLEAAMFGGIPEGSGYLAYAPHQFMRTGLDGTVGPYPRPIPRPPSPNLTAQRLLREQQDDEYLASLQADREKELKAIEDAEARRLEEQAAREAALEEERHREEESRRKLEEEQEFERQLAAKEASLPQEPASDDEYAVNLLVRMPDGSRRGRRFLKSDKLQLLFDFIDVGRSVKPGTYRLVRPYPRCAFGDGESALTLNELGLTSKQEALYLELI